MKYFFISLLISMLFMGCEEKVARKPENVEKASTEGVVDYGNGVYYFPYTQAPFANSLSAFLEENSALRVVAISSDGASVHGITKGYFVICEKK